MRETMPWIKEEKLYLIVFLTLIFIMAVRAPVDSDMWWHLRAGDETLSSGLVYRVDTFSSTRSGEAWINHSWLSQVMMAGLYRIGNLPALSIWVAVSAVASMGLVYHQMEGQPLLRGTVLILAALVSSVVWSPRPQIMSLVLLALLGWLLKEFRERRKWTILLAVPGLFALWGNLHGGYVLGLIYLGAYLGGEILDKILLRKDTQELRWREIGQIAIAIVAGCLFILINPFGIEMWMIPFNTIGVETLQNVINEWASPDFHQAFQQPILWMMLGLLGVLGLIRKPLQGYRLVPVVLFAWAALVARRNFGPFAIICAPALAEGISVLFDDWIAKAKESLPRFQRFVQSAEANKNAFNVTVRNLINLLLIGLLIAAGIIKAIQVNRSELISKAETRIYPVHAVEWIKDNPQSGNLFNEYNWGGYLIYHLPEMPVFVDGRTDLFGDEVLNDYLEVTRIGENWRGIIDEYDLGLMLLQKQTILSSFAIQDGWSVLYADELAILLERR
jgi:hypothetical protein